MVVADCMAYRVDNLPALLRPWVALYGWVTGGCMVVLYALLRWTMRVHHIGRPSGPTIQCAWHEALGPYFVACMPYREPYVWLNHPLWVMKGVHFFLHRMGVRTLVLGS